MKKSGVYIIRNTVNLSCYIGSSANLLRRWHVHKDQARKGRHHSKLLQMDWDKYGEDSFEFKVLEHIEPNRGKLEFNEQSSIWLYKPVYNSNSNVIHHSISDEGIRTLSNRMIKMNKERIRSWRTPEQIKRQTLTRMKLTEKQIYEIAKIYQDGCSQRDLAKKYNVLETTIQRIVTNKIKYFSNIIPLDFKRKPMTRVNGILQIKHNTKSTLKEGCN